MSFDFRRSLDAGVGNNVLLALLDTSAIYWGNRPHAYARQISANHTRALRCVACAKDRQTVARANDGQTNPAMPASAPAANSHRGFHGLRNTTTTVSSVIK